MHKSLVKNELVEFNKVAFLLHDPGMLNHFYCVWKVMDPANLTIVTTEDFYVDTNGNKMRGLDNFFKLIDKEIYDVKRMNEIVNCGITYRCVVTNHMISGNTKSKPPASPGDVLKKEVNRKLAGFNKDPRWTFDIDLNTYLPVQVGQKQIRFMYGADISDGWSLQSWNDAYDVFLCHGVVDQNAFRERFKGETFIMGYPRYDRYFEGDMDLRSIKAEFEIDDSKRTMLWMPTLGGEHSSIPFFAKALSSLSTKYNIVVRPHPISFVQEPEFILLLEENNFNIDRRVLRDMNELYSIADIVLPDYGGTPFSAVFLGKNVVFLDVPEGDSAAINIGSSVLELKKSLPVISHEEIERLDALAESEQFYIENEKLVDQLFVKYFNSPRGGGAIRVANYLRKQLE